MGSTLSVEGETDLKAAARLGSTLSVEGETDLKAAARIGSTLSVEGETDLKAAARIGSTLSVAGAATFSNNMFITGPKMIIPTNASQPTNNEAGAVHYNSATKVFEGLVDYGSGNFTWVPFGGVSDEDRDTKITAPGINDDTLEFYANDAITPKMTMKENMLSINTDVFMRKKVEISQTLRVEQATTLTSTLSIGDDVSIEVDKTLYVDNIKATNDSELVIDVPHLRLKGNLDIEGTWNSVNIGTEEIRVEDRRIVLGSSSNSAGSNNDVFDSAFNTDYVADGAGLEIFGVPTSDDDYDNNSNLKWEKSLLWNHSAQGIPSLAGVNSGDTESFWELKGGHFKMTHTKDTLDQISYAFRINESDQLEFHKVSRTWTGTAYATPTYKRVAKFGMVL